MAISIGNFSWQNPSLNSNTYTYSFHNQNSGTDEFLYVEVALSGSWSLTGVTWDGTPMTLLDTNLVGGSVNIRHYRYYLSSPSTGSNDLTINFSSQYTTSFAWFAQSLTGTSGIADNEWNGLANSPHIRYPNVADNDVVIGSGISQYPIFKTTIDGVDHFSPNQDVYANVQADQFVAEISPLLSAGTVDVGQYTNSTTFQVTNSWVKFSESAVDPGNPNAQGSWWYLLR